MEFFNYLKEIKINGQKEFNNKIFPLCLTIENNTSSSSLSCFNEWIGSHSNEIDELLREYKAIYFRGIPISNYNEFHSVVESFNYKGMDYIGGAAVRTQLTSRLFTSNESPSSEKIPFHHEMSQVPEPPTHLFFYCDIPSEIGGETPILPSNEIYQRMVERFPEFMQKVEELGVRYIRVMPCEDDPTSAIGRGWKSTFLTDSRGNF